MSYYHYILLNDIVHVLNLNSNLLGTQHVGNLILSNDRQKRSVTLPVARALA